MATNYHLQPIINVAKMLQECLLFSCVLSLSCDDYTSAHMYTHLYLYTLFERLVYEQLIASYSEFALFINLHSAGCVS